MGKPLWAQEGLTAFQFRLLWWMIDAGVVSGELGRGWIGKASADMKAHRVTISRALGALVESGVLKNTGRGYYALDPKALESGVEDGAVGHRETHHAKA